MPSGNPAMLNGLLHLPKKKRGLVFTIATGEKQKI
jgi:hypothetical protein